MTLCEGGWSREETLLVSPAGTRPRYISEKLTLGDLDRLTAILVMRWDLVGSTWAGSAPDPCSGWTWETWQPSRRLDQALQVAHKLNELGIGIELTLMPDQLAVRLYGKAKAILGGLPRTEAETTCRASLIPFLKETNP